MKDFVYETNCTESTYEIISELVERANQITYSTFLKYVDLDHLLEVFPFYSKDQRNGLTIKNDWAVSYWKSIYKGQLCYYVCHSRIEYIFIKNPNK